MWHLKARAAVAAMRAARWPCKGGEAAAPEFGHFDSLAAEPWSGAAESSRARAGSSRDIITEKADCIMIL